MTDRYRVDAVVVDQPGSRLARGVDTVTGDAVAIKSITSADAAALAGAIGSARAWQDVGIMPGISAVRDVVLEDDRVTVVTDWVDGINAASLCRAEGRPGLPFGRVLRWLSEVAAALDALHRCDPPAVHGDVKPGNIVISHDGAVLVDVSGPASPGTDGFRAPEVSAGAPATPAADRFALAATAHWLLSGVAFRVGELPDLDLGSHTEVAVKALVKGLAPEASDRPSTAEAFVQLLTPPVVTKSLPAHATAFVGRRHERDEIARALGHHRVVTLRGPGGVGKTRLALAVAVDAAHRFGGVHFVSLAHTDPSSALLAIATGVGVPDAVDVSAEAIAQHLASRDVLVVLDTCEHVLEAASAVAAALASVNGPTLLATSRQALAVEHELVRPVRAMDRLDAAQLFCERAHSADATFDPTVPGVAEGVDAVVAELDGLPLAIVLAASRVADVPLSEIAESAATRNATVEATIQWSVDLLPQASVTALAELSVFRGPFSRDAATAVVTDKSAIATLVAASLVEQTPSTHLRLLDAVRDVGAAIRISGASTVARRHAAHHIARAERAAALLDTSDQADVLAALVTEHDNDRAAFDYFVSIGDFDAALRYVIAMFRYWSIAGGATEGRVWAEQALLTTNGVAPATVARAMARAADLSLQCSAHERARELATDAVSLARTHHDDSAAAEAVNVLGTIAAASGQFDEARTLLTEALAGATALDDPRLASVASGNLGWVEMAVSNFIAADAALAASFESLRALGNEADAGNVLVNKGRVALGGRDADTALADLTRALDLLRPTGYRAGIALALSYLADVYLARGDGARAEASYQEALDVNRELENQRACVGPLIGLALAANALGDQERALAAVAEALALARNHAGPDGIAHALTMSAKLARRSGRPGVALEQLHEARELVESVPSISTVRILEELGAAHEALGDYTAAAEAFSRTIPMRIEEGRQPDPEDDDVRAARDRVLAATERG